MVTSGVLEEGDGDDEGLGDETGLGDEEEVGEGLLTAAKPLSM